MSKSQTSELNASWNAAYRRIFGFNKWEYVRGFINGLGRLDFMSLRLYLHLKFCSLNLYSNNLTFMTVMKIYYCSQNFKNLCTSVGMSLYDYEHLDRLSAGRIKAYLHTAFAQS